MEASLTSASDACSNRPIEMSLIHEIPAKARGVSPHQCHHRGLRNEEGHTVQVRHVKELGQKRLVRLLGLQQDAQLSYNPVVPSAACRRKEPKTRKKMRTLLDVELVELERERITVLLEEEPRARDRAVRRVVAQFDERVEVAEAFGELVGVRDFTDRY